MWPVFSHRPHPIDENGQEVCFRVELRHNADLDEHTAILTFELIGTDPATGEPKGQRHRVVFVVRPDPEPDKLQMPITSHTVEMFVPDLKE